jgi:hypothetical protein
MIYQRNGTGIQQWDADTAPMSTITVSFTFENSYTGTDMYGNTVQVTLNAGGGGSITRASIFATPTPFNFQIYTGITLLGSAGTPPFFRNTWPILLTPGIYTASIPQTASQTSTPPSGHPVVHTTLSGDMVFTLVVTLSPQNTITWNWAFSTTGTLPNNLDAPNFDTSVTVDPYTLKNGSSVNCGTTYSDVAPSGYGTYGLTISAWAVSENVSIVVS